MAYGLTDEQLLEAGQIRQDMPASDDFDAMQERQADEAAVYAARLNADTALKRQQRQALVDQISTWEAQGVPPENLQRAKAQLATYFAPQSAPMAPQPQNPQIQGAEAPLVNPPAPVVTA
tara:strand:+ start:61 stop:420 length:360 start_codon:yes stop_codon:yes gene_type:complete